MQIAEEWAVETEELIEDLENEPPPTYPYFSFNSAQNRLEERITELQQEMSRLGAIGIIGEVLFLIAYIIPYKRIHSGELAPALQRNLKRCNSCGRVCPVDSNVCAYCGNRFNEFQDTEFNQSYRNY